MGSSKATALQWPGCRSWRVGLFLSRSESAGITFFFSSRRRHTRSLFDWSSDVCSSDLNGGQSSSEIGDGNLVRNREIRLMRDGRFFLFYSFGIVLILSSRERSNRYSLTSYSETNNRSEERRVGKECRYRWSQYH